MALLAGITTVNAQLYKGDWMVGGQLALSTGKNLTNINVAPSAGLFIIDRLAVGAKVEFDYTKVKDDKLTTTNIGPFARYYFSKKDVRVASEKTNTQGFFKSSIRPFAEASVGFTNSKQDGEASVSATDFFIGPGLSYFFSQQVTLDALIGYHSAGSGGVGFKVGFQVFLFKKQIQDTKKMIR